MRLWSRLAVVTVASLLPFGCSTGTRTYKVSGTVTLDDQPLPEGEILFIPADGKLGPEPGKIKDGRFESKAKAGKNRVEISASKILPGGVRGAGGEPVPEEYIPERYNVQSVLAEEVKADGENRYEFKLQSKKK
jgi:hypothetical protein